MRWQCFGGRRLLAGCAILLAAGGAAGQISARRTVEGVRRQSSHCSAHLRRLAVAVLMYARDYDEMLPPMGSSERFRAVADPYVRLARVRPPCDGRDDPYTCPAFRRPYVPNRRTPRFPLPVHFSVFPRPARSLLLRDARRHLDGTWGVAYVDGHVKRLSRLPPEGLR